MRSVTRLFVLSIRSCENGYLVRDLSEGSPAKWEWTAASSDELAALVKDLACRVEFPDEDCSLNI
jgi:hypothetical protein